MIAKSFQIALVLASIPMRCLDEQNKPIRFGTACIINYCQKRILLTVSHVVAEGGWFIEIGYDPNKQKVAVQPIGKLYYFKKLSAVEKPDDIDFAFIEIAEDIIPFHQIIKDDLSIEFECHKHVLNSTMQIIPDQKKEYGFYGQTQFVCEKNPPMPLILSGDPRLEIGMKYIGLRDDFYCFKLNHKHEGDEKYKGCSGAPILDGDGNLVSLVVGGVAEEDLILGFPLAKYKSLIDVALENGAA